MSAKKNNSVLLIPGPQGWDVWEVGVEGPRLKARTELLRALEVDGLPSRDLHMAFPVREVSALPLKSPTTDAALFGDMAAMHIERMGMRPPVEMGNLSDCFEVAVRAEDSLLLPVVLAPPPEGALPRKSPASFDVSARCFPMPQDGVVVWREMGRWVFAIGMEGRPLYFQAIASPILGASAGKEIGMALMQLQFQGILTSRPGHCFVWLVEDEIGPSPEQLKDLGQAFGGKATQVEKPAPVFPSKPSALLPADTRAERIAKRKQQQTVFGIAALVVAYLGLVGWMGWALYEKSKAARIAQARADSMADGAGGVLEHGSKWEELEPITDTDHWPVEVLHRCAEAIPPGEGAGVRFTRAEFNNQLEIKDKGERSLVKTIRLQGESAELEQVNQFNLNLKRSELLAAFQWTFQPATETNTGAWSFFYDAVINQGGAE